uniref:Transcription factor CBF/NF-Y/archaeal histone domain-containing protein n=1 Tax=Chromera velia CCMP2878 TaxID=1169474 RepID=A0A0G4HLW9_9ALVE|mmetsp:Transcript_56109/g.109844  ORF Transcript_56109/g.109844 Transcript_56109/m.109844 type:complete len:302 (+) Transcript_56109:181-1086(+)|eukprot:Cvel_7423.t1-p1 / transcript=Cvel_7423.t1 / gene=Cvel_7423 / organism=Chromera_velia_CCMP2878 / gene_product=Nuclear transcription factor Y subunit C-6, putative / transcript_product=Nuclear transcription factor Y subunit C-6, putative / location=Cvel_scaffold388:2869-4947(-) / protein_length=301 / sequence_SO=supercontig / SO=protein_coding / is_pseudo=false
MNRPLTGRATAADHQDQGAAAAHALEHQVGQGVSNSRNAPITKEYYSKKAKEFENLSSDDFKRKNYQFAWMNVKRIISSDPEVTPMKTSKEALAILSKGAELLAGDIAYRASLQVPAKRKVVKTEHVEHAVRSSELFDFLRDIVAPPAQRPVLYPNAAPAEMIQQGGLPFQVEGQPPSHVMHPAFVGGGRAASSCRPPGPSHEGTWQPARPGGDPAQGVQGVPYVHNAPVVHVQGCHNVETAEPVIMVSCGCGTTVHPLPPVVPPPPPLPREEGQPFSGAGPEKVVRVVAEERGKTAEDQT